MEKNWRNARARSICADVRDVSVRQSIFFVPLKGIGLAVQKKNGPVRKVTDAAMGRSRGALLLSIISKRDVCNNDPQTRGAHFVGPGHCLGITPRFVNLFKSRHEIGGTALLVPASAAAARSALAIVGHHSRVNLLLQLIHSSFYSSSVISSVSAR